MSVLRSMLEAARTGIYPGSIATDVPPAHLRRFFCRDGERYRVRKPLRDPTFSRLDLISCIVAGKF